MGFFSRFPSVLSFSALLSDTNWFFFRVFIYCSTTLNLAEVVTGRVIGPQGVTGTRTTEWATAAAVSRITVYCLPVGKGTYLSEFETRLSFGASEESQIACFNQLKWCLLD